MLISIVVGSLLASTALGHPADLPTAELVAKAVSTSTTSITRRPVPKTTFGTQGPILTLIEGDGSEHEKSTPTSTASTSAHSSLTKVKETTFGTVGTSSQSLETSSRSLETSSRSLETSSRSLETSSSSLETSSESLETTSQHTASRTAFGGFEMTPRPRPTGYFGGGGKGRPKASSRPGGFLEGLFGFPRARTTSVMQPWPARPTAKSTAVSEPEATGRPSRGNGLSGWESKMKNPTFQIILSGVPDLKSNAKSITPNVDIYDIDLFMTEASTIRTLKRLNKTVICYFSAGTYEPGRPDSNKYAATDKGSRLLQWPSERWVRLSSAGVRRIIADRIQLAAQKGCDAVDPDNVDGYGERGGGLSLKRYDSVQFVQWMSTISAKYNLAIGLKNAMELLPEVSEKVQFAVNEECVKNSECTKYTDFVHKYNKPVFHIEYPLVNLELKPISMERKRFCAEYTPSVTGTNFQSVIKLKNLNGWVVYCDGKSWKTPTVDKASSRFSGRGNYVLTSNITEMEQPGPRNRLLVRDSDPESLASADSSESSTLDEDAIRADIARQDGFPFAPGKGSDQFISDEELMAYDHMASSMNDIPLQHPDKNR